MKNNIWIFIALSGLFVVFALVSVMVYFTGGKNGRLLKRKLALGASIIALTGVFNGCRPVVTCYEVAVEPVLNCVDSVDNDGNIVLNGNDSEIAFDCEYMYYQQVSYRLYSGNNIVAVDSCSMVFQDQISRLTIILPQQLNEGNFDLKLYYFRLSELQDDSTPFKQFKLKILDDGK